MVDETGGEREQQGAAPGPAPSTDPPDGSDSSDRAAASSEERPGSDRQEGADLPARSSGDPVFDAILDRVPMWVVGPGVFGALAVGYSAKWMSRDGGDLPRWLEVLWVILVVPLFALTCVQVYCWLQRQRSDADGSLHHSEQRPSDQPPPD